MPGKCEIMDVIRGSLDGIELPYSCNGKEFTKAIKTALCELGRKFAYQVRASGVDFAGEEWLYDVTWLQYSRGYEPGLGNHLIDVPLVAECEWGTSHDVKYDFEKLLQARAGVRLMIYGDFQSYDESRGDGVAQRLAGCIRDFNGSSAEDAWLLATWERSGDTDNGWLFRYFQVGLQASSQGLYSELL